MRESSTVRIYVALLDEATDVWRPVDAEHLGDDLYRIESANADPEDEHWEFQQGEVVRCRPTVLSDGAQSLVAFEKV